MTTETAKPRLYEKFQSDVLPGLMSKHNIKNVLAAPRLTKVVISMGVGEAKENKGLIDAAATDLTLIAGQKCQLTTARVSVSNFRLREGMPIGCRVTLRGDRMWEFVDRLISVVVPRIKDFRGLKSKLDGGGNYSMGLDDQLVFPEIDLDRVKHHQGMNITFVTTADNDALGRELLEGLGMPFRKSGKKA
ncbi:MAG: 50S ribosomal protein L5 [Planctomycetota bacterium]|nr:MAG: 50S ribosomal protein L5 [Planctomycetota bacterium]